MSQFSNPRVLKRFIKLMLALTVVMAGIWMGMYWYNTSVPGDFEVRQGDIFLSDGHYLKAIESFNEALREQPDHRGAVHGKAAALIALERYDEAEFLLSGLIDYLLVNLEDDDPTGVGALSAAYTNRGIIRDRQARYEEALADYIESVKIDYDLSEGPSWLEHLLYYNKTPSSALKRAEYLDKQLKLPEAERLMRMPEEDAQQRMYKP